VRSIQNTQMHSVLRRQSFTVLKQVVNIQPLGFKGLNCVSYSNQFTVSNDFTNIFNIVCDSRMKRNKSFKNTRCLVENQTGKR
jgi:hypothetical protein